MAIGSNNKYPKIIITEGTAPTSPDAGDQKLYIDSADHHLKRKNSGGTVTDIEVGGAFVDDTAYDATTWNGDTTHAPSKNAVRDKIETLSGGGRTLIASNTPSGTGTSTFSSIPGTYTHLEIEMVGRSTKASSNFEDLIMELNADTTPTNYRYSYFQVHTSGTIAGGGGEDRFIGALPAASSPANSAAQINIRIDFYALTTFNKQANGVSSFRYDNTSVQEIVRTGGYEWENPAAITQIVLKLPSGNFVAGTTIDLYGLT
jgi:hypothetical protein